MKVGAIFTEGHKPSDIQESFSEILLSFYVELEGTVLSGTLCAFQMFTAPISAILRKKDEKTEIYKADQQCLQGTMKRKEMTTSCSLSGKSPHEYFQGANSYSGNEIR